MGRPSILILPASHAVMTGIAAMRPKPWADQCRYRQSFVISAAVEGFGGDRLAGNRHNRVMDTVNIGRKGQVTISRLKPSCSLCREAS